MAIQLIQPPQGQVGSVQLAQFGPFQNNPTTQKQTFTQAIAEKSLLVCVGVYYSDSGSLNLPTDTAGNTWHTAKNFQLFQHYTCGLFYAFNSLASLPGNEVSLSITGGATMGAMAISQWSGVVSASDPLDVAAQASSTSSSVPTVSLTTTQPGLVLGWSCVAGPGGGAGGSGPGAGFTTLFDDKFVDLLQYQILATAGAVTLTAPPAEGAWQFIAASFKALQPNPVLDGANT
jgi:hypothetical protein